MNPSLSFRDFNKLLRLLDLPNLIHAGRGISIDSLGEAGIAISAYGNNNGVGDEQSFSISHAWFDSFIEGPFGVANTAMRGNIVNGPENVTIYARTPPRDGYLDLRECSPFFEPGYPIAIRKESHPFKEESTNTFITITGWFAIDVMHHCCVQP